MLSAEALVTMTVVILSFVIVFMTEVVAAALADSSTEELVVGVPHTSSVSVYGSTAVIVVLNTATGGTPSGIGMGELLVQVPQLTILSVVVVVVKMVRVGPMFSLGTCKTLAVQSPSP